MTILIEEEKKFNSKKRLDELKWRVKNCKCKYCGAPLRLRRILYGSNPEGRIELFCTECDRIEFGVEPEIYAVAKYFVDEFDFNIFPNNDVSEKTYQMNVAKVSEIIAWAYKNMGMLSENGFTVPIDVSKTILGEDIIYRDDNLDDVEVELLDMEVSYGDNY